MCVCVCVCVCVCTQAALEASLFDVEHKAFKVLIAIECVLFL